MDEIKVVSSKERPDLIPFMKELLEDSFPEWAPRSDVIRNIAGKFDHPFGKDGCQNYLYCNYYPHFQLALVKSVDGSSDELHAIAHSVPIQMESSEGDLSCLPDRGWDWAYSKAFDSQSNQIQEGQGVIKLLVGMIIVSRPESSGNGFSMRLLTELRRLASLDKRILAIPARPVLKCNYPLIPMNEYKAWKRYPGSNEPFDPWLRIHTNLGGVILNSCHHSGTITASLDEWRSWQTLPILGSGKYIFQGGLAPLDVDVENDVGRYIQENVWILYP